LIEDARETISDMIKVLHKKAEESLWIEQKRLVFGHL
jgi:hypothetical protein